MLKALSIIWIGEVFAAREGSRDAGLEYHMGADSAVGRKLEVMRDCDRHPAGFLAAGRSIMVLKRELKAA